MAAQASLDLERVRAGCANTLAITLRCLVALDHVDAVRVAPISDGRFEQGRLSGSRRTHQIDRENLLLLKVISIVPGGREVRREQPLA